MAGRKPGCCHDLDRLMALFTLPVLVFHSGKPFGRNGDSDIRRSR
jgi:hypothetical protein